MERRLVIASRPAFVLWLLAAVAGGGCNPACDEDSDGFRSGFCDGADCDDSSALANPRGVEVCDGLDNDCDGKTDGQDVPGAELLFLDIDRDGYGNPDEPRWICFVEGLPEARFPTVDNALDCDDRDPFVTEGPEWWQDGDGDGFGGSDVSIRACDQPDGYSSDHLDCDDGEALVHPGAEDPCDGRDSDCDGVVEAIWYRDGDGDGFGLAEDTLDACDPPAGWVADDTECDDDHAEVHPGHEELCGDGFDNNCDGTVEGCGVAGEIRIDGWGGAIMGQTLDQFFGATVAAVGTGSDARLLAGSSTLQGSGGGGIHLFDDVPTELAWQTDAPTTVLWGDTSLDTELTVATGGDVNGDGSEDLLVGSASPSGVGQGRVWLFLGPLTGELTEDDAAASFEGDVGDLFGHAVAFVPDMDADGDDEIVIGAPGALSERGRVSLILGDSGAFSLDPAGAHATFAGSAEGDQCGWSVAGLEDVDADGAGELVMGAPHRAPSGGAFLFRHLPQGQVDCAGGDLVITDGIESSYIGSFVGSADTDGDGAPELLVLGVQDDLNPGPTAPPALWVHDATASGVVSATDSSFTLRGAESLPDPWWKRYTAASAGDLNGDGADDLALVSRGVEPGNTVGIYLSPFQAGVTELTGASATLTRLYSGEQGLPYNQLLQPMAALGDLDGDGYGDLAVGNPGATAALNRIGIVRVLFGGPGP
jgi:hypothetical protein